MRRQKMVLLGIAPLAAIAAGFTFLPSRCAAPPGKPSTRLLARLDREGRARPGESPEAALTRIAALDASVVRAAAPGADDLAKRAAEVATRLSVPGRKEAHLAPSEAEDLRLLAHAYLQQSKLLARVATDGADIEAADDAPPATRARGLVARLAAGFVQQDLSVAFATSFESVKIARDQLDRPLERDGVPARLFRAILESSRSLRGRSALREAIDRFQAAEVQRVVLEDGEKGDLQFLAKRIYGSPAYNELRKDESPGRVLERPVEKIEAGLEGTGDAADRTWYPVQVFISTLIGDAVTERRAPRITADEVDRTRRERVKPGDVVLERCDFYLSNSFLPGWWGHSALYVGDRKDIEQLGLAAVAAVAPHLGPLGEGHDLIEAVSEGVLLSSLAHVMRADHIAVLRPHYKDDADRKRAIQRAFANLGKAYDFKFDFESDDVLVCSEVCWRSLEGVTEAPLVKRFGRYTLTPDDLAKLALGEKPQLDFVCFIQDGKDASAADFAKVIE